MGLALGTNLKFHTIVTKGLKLKARKFWCLILTFAEVTEEKLVRDRGKAGKGGGGGELFALNRVKNN